MKISPINEKVLNALTHVVNYAKHSKESSDTYPHKKGLQDSIELVIEFVGCFTADGKVSQRGRIPSAWNKETIFEDSAPSGTPYIAEEKSASSKDATAKKLLKEIV